MKVKTNIKANGWTANQSEIAPHGLKVKTNIKVGGWMNNHNQSAPRGLKVKKRQIRP